VTFVTADWFCRPQGAESAPLRRQNQRAKYRRAAVNRTDRLYAIVEELRAVAPAVRSASWLAQRFEVSGRTIERDVSALQQAGVAIYATPGRLGGYGVDESTTLPPVNFTPEEATAVALALDRQAGGPFSQAARVALRKILGAMSGADAEAAQGLAGRVQLIDDSAPPRASIPRVVEQAVVDRRVLRITYGDDEGNVTRRDVEPVAFVGSDSQWYLVGWCRLRADARVFRIDRMRSAVLTRERAPERSFDEVSRPGHQPSMRRLRLDVKGTGETPTG
jgi:predicted DNA-binding transcriptional regulator YafY